MNCKNCGKPISDNEKFCTGCGAAQKREKTALGKKQIIAICVSGFAVLAIICVAVFLPRKKETKMTDTPKNPTVSENASDAAQPEKTADESDSRETVSEAAAHGSEVGVQNPSSETGALKPSSEIGKTDITQTAPSAAPETVSEQLKITDGYFYEYSLQDVFADEWRFFADGTCTVKMRPQSGLREYQPEYCTYTMNGNTVLINRGGSTVKWEFSPEEKCCYCYFRGGYSPDDNSILYRVTVFHSDSSLAQSEIDEGIKEYSGERKHIIRVS